MCNSRHSSPIGLVIIIFIISCSIGIGVGVGVGVGVGIGIISIISIISIIVSRNGVCEALSIHSGPSVRYSVRYSVTVYLENRCLYWAEIWHKVRNQ